MVDHAKIALFDLDDTLADYTGGILTSMRALQCEHEEPVTLQNFYRPNRPRWLDERVRVIRLAPGWWRGLPANPLGMALFGMAQSIGFEVHILTKGPAIDANAWKEKVEWCRDNLQGDYKITITEDKSTVYGRVLVDDYPPYMLSWLKFRPRGLGIMPVRPYNHDFGHNQVLMCDQDNLDEARLRLTEAYHRPSGAI